jgi:hypothetical protein
MTVQASNRAVEENAEKPSIFAISVNFSSKTRKGGIFAQIAINLNRDCSYFWEVQMLELPRHKGDRTILTEQSVRRAAAERSERIANSKTLKNG